MGGGPSALAAAFELTATEELRARHHVIVLQPGWRLGGKGASGRNAAIHNRIEEHGLHIWFGFYDNAFTLMQQTYKELGRPKGAPLRTWEDAFSPCDHVVLYEQWTPPPAGWDPTQPYHEKADAPWISHDLQFPRNPFPVGRERDLPLHELVLDGAAWAAAQWERLRDDHPPLPEITAGLPQRANQPCVLRRISGAIARAGACLLDVAGDAALEATGLMLRGFRDWLAEYAMPGRWDDEDLRLLYTTVDLLGTSVRGMAAADVTKRGFGRLNDVELTDWLRSHGAQEVTLVTSPVLRALYDGSFAYRDGDKKQRCFAAGKGLQDAIRTIFLYKQAILWKMESGMGDTVFAPLHDVLLRRGVDIRYFHAVKRLAVDEDVISRVDVVEQVHVKDGPYRPFIDVDGLPCWPNQPDWKQLEEGRELRARWRDDRYKADPEHVIDPLGMGSSRWLHGVHFDDVILAVPPDVQEKIAGELRADPAYDAMLDAMESVVTQAVQLWLDRSIGPGGLDWPYPANSIMSSYVEPLDTYCNMNQLIPREQWPKEDNLLDVAYFCGVIPHGDCPTPRAGDAAVRAKAIAFLETAAHGFWPRARGEGGRAFDWSLLIDHRDRKGAKRFGDQYWRSNSQPTERYVLTPPGSMRKRLPADGTRFTNLTLCGDWTRNGIDAGCIEASVTSGMLASRAICGHPEHIPGTGGWLSRD